MKDVEVIKARNTLSPRARTNFEKRLRVAAYCRVSTDTEDQLNSYKSQVEYYTELIKSKPEWSLAGIYADEAITGTQVKKREDFQRLINDCMNGDVDMVITKSISRFARNTLDTLKYVRMLKDKGVAVFFEDATLTLVPASAEQLDSMTDGFAPLTPALLPYGVKKALTTASTAAGWTGAEKTAALRTLGADLTAYYTRLEADAKFGTPYTLPPATADQLGGVKVGDYLDIAADGTLSGKTLYDTIAASVAVKSEPRLVWNTSAKTPSKWQTFDIKVPDNVDYVRFKAGYPDATEVDLARGGSTIYRYKSYEGASATFDFSLTFQADGTLIVKGPYTNSNFNGVVTFYLTGYHYPTLADLLTQVTAVESSVTDLQVALCELYEEKEEN